MNTTTTRTCQKCSKETPQNRFSCIHCSAPQEAGGWNFKTQDRTHIAPGTPPLAARLRSVFAGGPFAIALVGFWRAARILLPLSPVEKVSPISLEIHDGTNGEVALERAEEALFGNAMQRYARNIIILMTDGAFNCSNTILGRVGLTSAEAAKKAAVAKAALLKNPQGVRIGTILFDRGEHDAEPLKQMASDENLFFKAGRGELMKAMLSLSRIATQTAQSSKEGNVVPGSAIVFCLDSSPSMREEGKKEEAEQAFWNCIEELRSCQ